MIIPTIIFYLFATVLIASAIMVVASKNAVHSVLFLILCFFNAAGLFVLMGAEFIAFILMIVYVGAVAVLFLFVVMMLDINAKDLRREVRTYLPIGLTIGLIVLAQLALVVGAWVFDPQAITMLSPAEIANQAAPVDNTRAIGRVLYTDYMYPFQVCGLILLVAMIGAIVLTLRQRKDARKQSVGKQLSIKPSDVIEIHKIKSGEGVW